MSKNIGKVSKVIGAVVDVEFSSKESTLPEIYDSLEIKREDGTILVLEVQSHIGENIVRTISMDSTDGLSRGTEVIATGNPIQMPIGKEVYGRLFNVVGDPIDGLEVLPKILELIHTDGKLKEYCLKLMMTGCLSIGKRLTLISYLHLLKFYLQE